MNNNAKKWIAALRSGEFKQIRNGLKSSHGHCCLGVACEIAIKCGVPIQWKASNTGFRIIRKESGLLPREVADFMGVRTIYGTIFGRGNLAAMNDQGKTFAEIADIIESEPEGLFVK